MLNPYQTRVLSWTRRTTNYKNVWFTVKDDSITVNDNIVLYELRNVTHIPDGNYDHDCNPVKINPNPNPNPYIELLKTSEAFLTQCSTIDVKLLRGLPGELVQYHESNFQPFDATLQPLPVFNKKLLIRIAQNMVKPVYYDAFWGNVPHSIQDTYGTKAYFLPFVLRNYPVSNLHYSLYDVNPHRSNYNVIDTYNYINFWQMCTQPLVNITIHNPKSNLSGS